MFLSILGGYLAGVWSGILSPAQYEAGLLLEFVPFNLFFGLIKAFVFAFIITSVSAYFGYYVKGGSLEIGRSSTMAVVVSCVLILLADYGLAALLL
jgi:phospholipid/cholesterol/gamma-HCH transport system permease protein